MNPTWWAMELGMFHYMTIDMKATVAGTTLKVNLISRITTGDNFNSAVVTIGGPDERYGPQAQVGVWTTYKIPFLNPSGDSTDLYSAQMGFGQPNSDTQLAHCALACVKASRSLAPGRTVKGPVFAHHGRLHEGQSVSRGVPT
jgi:hypothetical protein